MVKSENKIPDLVFIYPENYSDEQIADDTYDIEASKLDLRILKRGNAAINGFEWIIPTAIGAYIFKPYFDSFLSEAGKDHYNLLKKTLAKLIKRGKIHKAKVISASQSADKLSLTYSQSFIISIEVQTFNGRKIKLLFDDNLDLSDWQNAVEQFLEMLLENYEAFPNDKLTSEIEKLKTKEYRIIYCIINPKTKALEFNDDKTMLAKNK